MNKDFIKRSFTGSKFYGSTRDFHAFKFSVHGYFDWRNIIIAKSVLKFKEGAIIEVGANIGTETISFSDIAKKYNQLIIMILLLVIIVAWVQMQQLLDL